MKSKVINVSHDCHDLISIFNTTFALPLRTQLEGGGSEPVYQPASSQLTYHKVIFTQDYFASALHECAHWCVAGPERRLQEDYGYWYAPDGRTEAQQEVFERVEVKPQALEWIMAEACGFKFQVSADNLTQGLGASEPFKEAIYQRVRVLCEQGLTLRPGNFIAALLTHYQPTLKWSDYLHPQRFNRESL